MLIICVFFYDLTWYDSIKNVSHDFESTEIPVDSENKRKFIFNKNIKEKTKINLIQSFHVYFDTRPESLLSAKDQNKILIIHSCITHG